MTQYDLILAKEVAREGAWEIMSRICKVEEKIGENTLLDTIYTEFGNKTQTLPGMTFEEIKQFECEIQFLNRILKKIQGV